MSEAYKELLIKQADNKKDKLLGVLMVVAAVISLLSGVLLNFFFLYMAPCAYLAYSAARYWTIALFYGILVSVFPQRTRPLMMKEAAAWLF